MPNKSNISFRMYGLYVLCFVALVLSIVIIVNTPSRQDYQAYTYIWNYIWQGQDPWHPAPSGRLFVDTSPTNAYGPLFILFAPLSKLHEQLPRVLWAVFWFTSVLGVSKLCSQKSEASFFVSIIIPLYFLLSPLFWLQNVFFGKFDIVVAVLVFWGLLLADRGKHVSSGILFGLGVALKYYPLLLIPFVAYKKRRVIWPFVFSNLATLGLIFTGTFLIWGDSFTFALRFAASRSSQFISLFRFLRSDYSPFHFFFGIDNLDYLSAPCLILAVVLFFGYFLIRRLDVTSGVLLAFIITLFFYKVGHEQYHLLLHYLLVLWIIQKKNVHPVFWIVLAMYILFINLFSLGYTFRNSLSHWEFISVTVGLVSSILLVSMFWMIHVTDGLFENIDTKQS